MSVRIRAGEFSASRNQKRILRRDDDLVRAEVAAEATREQFALLRTYLDSRHPGGGMSDMGLFDYVAMVEETPVDTHIVEYRTARRHAGGLRPHRPAEGRAVRWSTPSFIPARRRAAWAPT